MNDRDIRTVLRKRLDDEHEGSESVTRIIEELGVLEGASRVDIAVLNGSMHGFEIKSTRDTLERLPRQCEAYGKCFDRVTLVVSEKHLEGALAIIPDWWGVSVAKRIDDVIVLDDLRMPEENQSVDMTTIVRMLWRDEARKALEKQGHRKGLRTKRRKDLWAMLLELTSCDELRDLVRETIKARGDWRAEMRQARDNDSSPSISTQDQRQLNIQWLLSGGFQNLPD